MVNQPHSELNHISNYLGQLDGSGNLASGKRGSRRTIHGLCKECEAYLKAGALPEKAKPEAQTQQLLVTPLLELLGWPRKPNADANDRFVTEYGVSERGVKWTDYALIVDDTPVLFVEAKELFEKLDGHVKQLLDQIQSFNRENPGSLTVYWAFSRISKRFGSTTTTTQMTLS